ncbi:MAG: hypothetical protein IJA69_04585 [Clostridia bacterium]|nr:hypothetical protein [Clostridia bacterium]
MKIKEALELIKQKYPIREKIDDFAEIVVDKMLNRFSYYYIAIHEEDGKCYLNDLANTCDAIALSEEEIKQICEKHNVSFDDWHLSLEYENVDSVEKLIACIDEIVEEYKKLNNPIKILHRK